MAKKVIAANLLDMIELITSRKLQEAVFTQNAPNMNVNWDRLPKNNRSPGTSVLKSPSKTWLTSMSSPRCNCWEALRGSRMPLRK